MKRLFPTLICFCMFSLMQAQIHEVGLFAGASNFIGDVGPTNYINPNEPALGILYKWNRSPRHSWRASFTYARLAASDADSEVSGRHDRGYSFDNSIKELSLGLEFDFFEFDLHDLRRQITPYIYGGLSYFRYDSQYVQNGTTKVDDQRNSLAIPMVLGVKSNITPKLVLGFEVGARYTFADDIDGSNPEEKQYQPLKFGNINSNDWYVFTGFTLTYSFGNSPCFCPE